MKFQYKKKQICLIDPDSKSMKNNEKFEVSYNMQTAVDSKNKLIINYDLVNEVNDQSQLSNMVNKSRQIFKEDEMITVVADTGYFNMAEIIDVIDKNTKILIKEQKAK